VNLGINCETCEEYYYRPAGVAQNDSHPCLPCDCAVEGIAMNPVSKQIGDCVVNNDSPLPINHLNRLMVS